MTIIKNGKLRGEKIKYPDGIGCCIWYPFPCEKGEEEESGICFDFANDDIDELIGLLEKIKQAEPEIYHDDEARPAADHGC